MDGSIASGDADPGSATAFDVKSTARHGLTLPSEELRRSVRLRKFVNLLGAIQVALLASIVLTGLLFGKELDELSTAQHVDGVLLVCGFAILTIYWGRGGRIGKGTVVETIAERAAHVAFLVLAATFLSAHLAAAPWESLAPTRTFAWLSGIAASGVAVLVLADWFARDAIVRRIAIFGEGDAAFHLAQRLQAQLPDVDVCLMSAAHLASQAQPAHSEPTHADPKIVELAPDVAIISTSTGNAESAARLASHLAPLPVDVLVQAPYTASCGPGPIVTLGRMSFVRIFPRPLANRRLALKRAFDVLGSAAILTALLPLLVTVALAIKLDSRGPILFRQPRVGRAGVHFTILKFRTMRVDSQDVLADRLTARNDPRVTRVGSLLRKTSIDELPQLLNVLMGSMSLVGPRPHALNAKADGEFYSDVVAHYHARHRVKPGITGLAQIAGWRGPTDTHAQIEQRVANDLRYIAEWSLHQDALIVVRTAFALFGKNAL